MHPLFLPIGESVFDVVAGGVDEHSAILPASTLQTHVLIDSAQALQLPVAYGQRWETQTQTTHSGLHEDGITGTIDTMDVRWMSGGCQVDVRWVSGGCQVGVRWVSGGCQVDVRWVSGGCQVGVRWKSRGVTQS